MMASNQHTEPSTASSSHAMSSGKQMEMMKGSYARFAAMVATSTVVMFVLMYSLVLEAAHVRFADTRFLMALYMGAAMTAIMLAFMLGMYHDKRKNTAISRGRRLSSWGDSISPAASAPLATSPT